VTDTGRNTSAARSVPRIDLGAVESEVLEATRRLSTMVEEMAHQRQLMLSTISPWSGILEHLHALGPGSWTVTAPEAAARFTAMNQLPNGLLEQVARPQLGGILELGTHHFIDQWRESERQLSLLAPKAQELGRRGWTLPVRWGVMDFVHVVDEVPEEDLDDAWVAFYSIESGKEFEELARALTDADVLEPWRRLIDGAIYTYRGGWYEAAVPTLFACFDGAFAAATHGPSRHAQVHTTAIEFRKAAELATREVCWASIQGFAGVTHRTHPFSDAPPTAVNRHWLLHGRALPPRPQADCLRLLQALETLTLVARD
jgi:hypothetical protein